MIPIVPFEGLPFWAIAFVYASVFFGFYVRGAFGFGSNMPIVLLVTWVLGPHHTILVVALAAAISQLHLLPQGPRSADWRVTLSLVPAIAVGIGIGTWVLTRLDASGLMAVMGALVLGVVVMDRMRVVERLSRGMDLRAPAVSSTLALISGTLGTISGGGGLYFLAGYLRHACPDQRRFRGTNIVVAGSFMIVRVIALSVAGLVLFEYVVEAVALLPVIFGGTWAGTRFFHSSSPRRFYGALQAIMLLAALALLVQGVLGVV